MTPGPSDPIRRLRSRVRARVKGEALPAWGASEGLSLAEGLAAGDAWAVAVACYRLDEREALACGGDLARAPDDPAVPDELLQTLLASLPPAPGDSGGSLPAPVSFGNLPPAPIGASGPPPDAGAPGRAVPGEDTSSETWAPADLDRWLARLLAVPEAVEAVRGLVGLLERGADGGRRGEAITRAWGLVPAVFSPWGRWRLTRALAAVAGDVEELARADERYRAAAEIWFRVPETGRAVVDGYPWHGDPTQPLRVAPGRHTAGLVLETVTRLQRLELAPGERRTVALQANLLRLGFEGRGVEHDPETGLPLRLVSEVDGVEMLYVPPGEFELGLDPAPDSVAQAAVPQDKLLASGSARRVQMHGFYIDRRPCPVEAFRRFVQRGGYASRGHWSEAGWDAHHGPKSPDRQAWERWALQEARRLPPGTALGHVSWHEASAAARWAGKRLPTEAEWERAMLYLGSAALGLKQAEWCADTWHFYPPADAPHPGGAAPAAGLPPPDAGSPAPLPAPFVDGDGREAKVLRGTILSFHGDPITARIRADADPEERFWTVGFRTVWMP